VTRAPPVRQAEL